MDLGKHRFDFDINKQFFAEFEQSEIQEGELKVEVNLMKEERMITLEVKIEGTVQIRCDRCLEYFGFPIEFDGNVYIKPIKDVVEEKIGVFGVEEDETEINLAQYLYESIHLMLPLRRVHPDDEDGNSTCNEDMLKLIEKYEQGQDDESIDPRWEKLRNLFVERN
mgnify:FL=1